MRKLGLLLSLLLTACLPAQAQDWPAKPIQMIVPFPSGGDRASSA